jgi:hypothetical protein
MGDEGEPRRIFLGSFEAGLHHLIIPAPVTARANATFDAERARREKEAAQQKAQALGDARARGKLARVLKTILRRGRRR